MNDSSKKSHSRTKPGANSSPGFQMNDPIYSELRNLVERLTLLTRFEITVSEILSDLQDASLESFTSIEKSLETIGDHFGANCVQLLVFNAPDGVIEHGWKQDKTLKSGLTPFHVERLIQGEKVTIPELPEEDERENFKAHEIGIPMKSGNTTLGAFWICWEKSSTLLLDEEINLLQTLGNMLIHIIKRREAEQQIIHERDFANSILENAKAAICVMDMDDRFIYINPFMEQISGYKNDEIIGKQWINTLIPQNDQYRARKLFKNVICSMELLPETFPIVTKDGQIRIIEWYDSILTDKEGKIYNYSVIGHDITERKEAEVKLRQSEEKYRELQKSIPIGVFQSDKQGVFTSLNSAALSILGLESEEDITSCNLFELPQDKNHQDFLRSAIETDGLVQNYLVQSESNEQGIKWLSISVKTIYGENNQIYCYNGIIEDVTDKKDVEDRQKESEAKYKTIVENSLEGIFVIKDDKIVFCNFLFSQMLGYRTIGETINLPVESIISKEIWPSFAKEIHNCMQGFCHGTPISIHAKRKDGSSFEAETLISSILYEGRPAVQGAIRDVSEQHRLREQLVQSQKMESIGRLAGGIAHDFNNLLTSILGNVDLANENLDNGQSCQIEIKEIEKNAERAIDLVKQLLVFSKKQVREVKVMNLNECIVGMKPMLQRLIGEDITLVHELDDDLWNTRIERIQLEQIILNLAVNARDAMMNGGTIKLHTENMVLFEDERRKMPNLRPGPHVILRFTDTGDGMDEEVLSKLFEPFYTTKGEGKGTGLGLSTVYGIVRQADGWISVDSEIGKGTEFCIYFPRVYEDIENDEKETFAPELKGGSERIMIVEDDPAVRKILKRVFEKKGYAILSADSGKTALELAKKQETPPDLIISDIIMPDMSGPDFIEEVKRVWTKSKILFISGYSKQYLDNLGKLKMKVYFLSKPFQPSKILKIVRAILDEKYVENQL